MEAQGGYDQDRFISTVPRRLVCGICHQVVRDPRLCEDGEHCFCLSCISRYLNRSLTCPECEKPLTPETLVRPQSYLRESLGEQLIKCDYIERGCPEHIQLGNLNDHVSRCGFAPVTCEKCGMQINRKDKNNHEKSLCQLGATKCQNCESMKEELCQLKAKLDDIEASQNLVPAQLNEIMNENQEYLRSIDENQSELKRKHDQMEEKLKSINKSLKKSKRKRNQVEIPLMAAARGNVQESYDVSRFVGEVKEDLLCLTCKEVPKDPRLCKNKDHIFCLTHILQHLENSQTCPYCKDPLTLETLRRPTGFLKNCLDDLKIKCDYHDRGCPDVIGLERLASHVNQCEFAPVMCGIEGCEMVVNKSEKENHEKNLCQFRNVKHYDNTKIKASLDEMKASLDEMKASLNEMKAIQADLKERVYFLERTKHGFIYQNKDEMKVELNKMKDKMTGMEGKQDEMQDEMQVELNKMKDKMTGIERKQDQTQENLKSTIISLDESKRKQDELKLTVTQLSLFRRLTGRKIITMGGMNADHNVLSSVTTFNLAEQAYADLPPMNYPRYDAASCCVYNNHVTIAGGSLDGSHGLNSIEILKINQHPLQWTIFENILPFKLSCHVLTVHQQKLLLIGGYNWDRRAISNEMYELPLTPPYTPTLRVRMPQPRNMHSAEIVNGSLFILGGRSTNNPEDGLDSVIRYDPTSNGFIECASLLWPVSGMSTVTWRNKIIVIGGEDIHGRALNDVIMYDTESGQRERLPSLNHKRSGHSAVIIDNVIVVFEGRNEEGYLNSGEIFIMGTDQWKELPEMTKRRYGAAAVVKP